MVAESLSLKGISRRSALDDKRTRSNFEVYLQSLCISPLAGVKLNYGLLQFCA